LWQALQEPWLRPLWFFGMGFVPPPTLWQFRHFLKAAALWDLGRRVGRFRALRVRAAGGRASAARDLAAGLAAGSRAAGLGVAAGSVAGLGVSALAGAAGLGGGLSGWSAVSAGRAAGGGDSFVDFFFGPD
jgi:hypothetical protein